MSAQYQLDRIRAVAAEMKADMEADVRDFEGKPFSGKTVGEMHGNLAAGISALAGMAAVLADIIEAGSQSEGSRGNASPGVCACGTTLVVCSCEDERCPACDPHDCGPTDLGVDYKAAYK